MWVKKASFTARLRTLLHTIKSNSNGNVLKTNFMKTFLGLNGRWHPQLAA
jgi:hypothetical protein